MDEGNLALITDVLRRVAKEIVERVSAEMPALAQGETIVDEYFQDGIFTRVTLLRGDKIETRLDLKKWNIEGADYIERKRAKRIAKNVRQ